MDAFVPPLSHLLKLLTQYSFTYSVLLALIALSAALICVLARLLQSSLESDLCLRIECVHLMQFHTVSSHREVAEWWMHFNRCIRKMYGRTRTGADQFDAGADK